MGHGAPLFIHPGRAEGSPAQAAWWAPAVSYVAQQQAAWHAFHAAVRPEFPRLHAIFALLAGLATAAGGAQRRARRSRQ